MQILFSRTVVHKLHFADVLPGRLIKSTFLVLNPGKSTKLQCDANLLVYVFISTVTTTALEKVVL